MIRPLRSDDYPGLVRLLRALRADSIYTPSGMRHLIESMPERAANAAWVADEGEIVGWGWAHRRWQRASDTAFAWVGVLANARGRGLGGELWQLAESHASSLGAAALFTDVVGDPAGERFVTKRGFSAMRVDVVSAVDVGGVDLSELDDRERAAAKDGYRLSTLRNVELRDLYGLDVEIANDMPGVDAPREISFDEWRTELADQPDLDWDASAVIVGGSEPVALCLLTVDRAGRRARNEGTGTARAHRRRGLATLAKLAVVRCAADLGIETIITDNADQNVGMLAINNRLGYQPLVERRRWRKELREAETAS